MRIGIDIMGGDYSPKKTIQGTILAQKELSSSDKLYLFGEKNIILKHLELKIPSLVSKKLRYQKNQFYFFTKNKSKSFNFNL